MQVRTYSISLFEDIFAGHYNLGSGHGQRLDVILTPGTATAAPFIPESAFPDGLNDAVTVCPRFVRRLFVIFVTSFLFPFHSYANLSVKIRDGK